MKNQNLRNLTTGRLHTHVDDIYEDIEFITGDEGIMTHHLGMACKAMQPWLREKITDARFWDGAFDLTHEGETEIIPMNAEEKKAFFVLFAQQPNPLLERLNAGK